MAAMEELLKRSWGVELYSDGGKGLWPFGKSGGSTSKAFTRVYHMPLEEGLRAFVPWGVVRFFYDNRVNEARLIIPDNSVQAFLERFNGAKAPELEALRAHISGAKT